ncbi:MAG TPA: hypothetical protein VFH53_08700 [Phycisphaerae bacterium]|nr:hypothetical protein [Phycisphaerae bacterium]HUX15637.1 hypothetical protein [Phycisphaerae bacterium]
MSEPNDHDLLIRIDERVTKLDRCMTGHLAQHWGVTLAALGAMLTALASIAVALGTK